MDKILITGATGLIGSHIVDWYKKNTGNEVFGTKTAKSEGYLSDYVKYFDCDIVDTLAIQDIVNKVEPDFIFHMAGQVSPGLSFSNPLLTYDVNVKGTINLFEAVKRAKKKPTKIIVAGSASVYGKTEDYPTAENAPFNPMSIYGSSKASVDILSKQYYENFGLRVVVVRPYIIIGARQGLNNSVQTFAHQIVKIENGKQNILHHGNLESSRDFTDVKDCVRAIIMLAEKGINGEAYNICSGMPRKIKDILHDLISLSSTEIRTEVDTNRIRPSDVPLERGDFAKLNKLTGWTPEIEFKDTLKGILDYWRKGVG